jgi:hypothetical protein
MLRERWRLLTVAEVGALWKVPLKETACPHHGCRGFAIDVSNCAHHEFLFGSRSMTLDRFRLSSCAGDRAQAERLMTRWKELIVELAPAARWTAGDEPERIRWYCRDHGFGGSLSIEARPHRAACLWVVQLVADTY